MHNAGCRSLRSKDSSQGDGHDAVGDFVKELEHTRRYGLFGPRDSPRRGSEALAKCLQERAERDAAKNAQGTGAAPVDYRDLPIQISDMRHLAAEWESNKKLMVIMTGCSAEVQHSVGPMSCLVANPAFERFMFMNSKQLLHKPVSKLFGPGNSTPPDAGARHRARYRTRRSLSQAFSHTRDA